MVELFHYLQDPHLVARFQRVCGVRGTFSRTASDGTHAHNNGDCRGHISGEKESEKPVGRRGRSENGPQNGAVNGREEGGPDAGPPGSSSTLKPLRKNSLTGDAGLEFVIENRFLYYLFTFGTELGNELFYITFFPFVMWNVDAFVARRLVLVWVWVMYLGQCTKDVLGWSRPTSPPVVKVEMLYNSEYSMPSTHAMSATAIPVSLFLLSFGRWQVRGSGRLLEDGPVQQPQLVGSVTSTSRVNCCSFTKVHISHFEWKLSMKKTCLSSSRLTESICFNVAAYLNEHKTLVCNHITSSNMSVLVSVLKNAEKGLKLSHLRGFLAFFFSANRLTGLVSRVAFCC